MAKIGSEKKPIIVTVASQERSQYVAETCSKNGWHYIIGIEPHENGGRATLSI